MLIKNEKSLYVGAASEADYKTGRTLGRVAEILLGDNDNSEDIVNETIGKGYETRIEFECR